MSRIHTVAALTFGMLLWAAPGCSSGSGDGGGAVRCTGTNPSFPSFDRSCTTSADCVLVQHVTSCCGSTLVMSIASSAKSSFASAEKACDAQYPACGCASQGIDVEDGTLINSSEQNLVASVCDGGRCAAHYTGETFACGDAHCTPDQICWITNQANSPSRTTCQFSGGCTDCSCATGTGCSCAVQNGHITVTCTASP